MLGRSDKRLRLWDAATGAPVGSTIEAGERVTSLCGNGGHVIASASQAPALLPAMHMHSTTNTHRLAAVCAPSRPNCGIVLRPVLDSVTAMERVSLHACRLQLQPWR